MEFEVKDTVEVLDEEADVTYLAFDGNGRHIDDCSLEAK